jgi:phage terminase large subunit
MESKAATEVSVMIPPKLIPVFATDTINGVPVRYRGAYGGRGSAKTRTFAKMAAIRGLILAQQNERGLIVCGREFMNSLDESSFAEVREAILSEPWLAAQYDIGEKYIRTRCGRIQFAFIGLRHNLDSIKSKARIWVLWIDEAEPVSETAWRKTIPTVREEGSEIWVTWNPERETSATHKRFRVDPPAGSIIVEMNYADNPWFPEVLERERLEDFNKRPDQYDHIWEGGFIRAVDGAYFASDIALARQQGRIGVVPPDPLMTYRAFVDIGGTGARADAFTIWIAQFVGLQVRVLDHYEVVGQPMSAHALWLSENNYTNKNTKVWLPHDGTTQDRVNDVSYEGAFKALGFKVEVIPNQGRGAATQRIEAARRLWPSIWINEPKCKAGLQALGWYHEKRDPNREIGLGPNHDWSSHSADSFGLMCICWEPPTTHNRDVNFIGIRDHFGAA